MKILIGINEQVFNGSISELKAKVDSELGENRNYVMYTLTCEMNRSGLFQFRAWRGPFANFYRCHADTGRQEDRLFSIYHNDRKQLLEAVQPFVERRCEWEPVNSWDKHAVRLWLSFYWR